MRGISIETTPAVPRMNGKPEVYGERLILRRRHSRGHRSDQRELGSYVRLVPQLVVNDEIEFGGEKVCGLSMLARSVQYVNRAGSLCLRAGFAIGCVRQCRDGVNLP